MTRRGKTNLDEHASAFRRSMQQVFASLGRQPSERLRLGSVVAVVIAVFYLQGVPLFRSLEKYFYDVRMGLLAQQTMISGDIVIVGVDDDSLNRLEPVVGRWPWPRAVMASVLDYCSQASVLALDILYAEHDWQYSLSDDAFVSTVQESGNVIAAIYGTDQLVATSQTDTLKAFAFPDPAIGSAEEGAFRHVIAPFPELLDALAGVGHVNAQKDRDGVARTHMLTISADGKVFPSLAFASVLAHLKRGVADVSRLSETKLQVGERVIHTDRDGLIQLRPSHWKSRSYRIGDVIAAWQAENTGGAPALDRAAFKDKIVLVGSVATGLMDDSARTSISSRTTGVELVATMIENMLSGEPIRDLAGLSLLLIALCALVPSIPRLTSPFLLLLMSALFGLLYLIVVVVAAVQLHWLMPVSGPLLALLLSGMGCGSIVWLDTSKRLHETENMDAVKEKLTAMLVHDLRNALGPVVMGLQLVETEDESFVKDTFLPAVRDSSDQLLNQINAILDIRKMEGGNGGAHAEQVDAAALMHRLQKQYGMAASRRGCTLVVVCGDEPIHAYADPGLLDRIMCNLLWNAIKFADPYTTIEFGCWQSLDGATAFFVGNHCSVIPTDECEQLFKEYKTNNLPSGSLRFHSTGLGLAFCRMAVGLHGGEISMSSPWPGHHDGVRIFFSLPVEPSP
jgi:CHASE2 domain-containing sensor protein